MFVKHQSTSGTKVAPVQSYGKGSNARFFR